jgi:hypothetical protein
MSRGVKMCDKSFDLGVIAGASLAYVTDDVFDGSVSLQNVQCKSTKNR